MGVQGSAVLVRTSRDDDCGRSTRLHRPRELLFREHDRAGRIYVVEDGLVMLSHIFSDGRRHIVDLIGPGELCAWECDPKHGSTAETLTFSTITSYEAARVEEAFGLHRDLSRRLRAAMQRMHGHAATLGRKTALERVASLIVRLWNICDPDDDLVYLPLTRREIADHLGLTQETVSRSFSELKRRGVICESAPNEVRIENARALARLAGSPLRRTHALHGGDIAGLAAEM